MNDQAKGSPHDFDKMYNSPIANVRRPTKSYQFNINNEKVIANSQWQIYDESIEKKFEDLTNSELMNLIQDDAILFGINFA